MQLLNEHADILPDYQAAINRQIDQVISVFDPLFDGEKSILLHGDCHRGNFIYRPGEGIYIVDFDDSVIGIPIQDLWMLLPGTPEECELEIEWFKEGYQTFRPFPTSQLKLIPALRAMRMIHFSAWCALQSKDADFATHFPEWGTMTYWNQWIKELQQLVAEFLESKL